MEFDSILDKMERRFGRVSETRFSIFLYISLRLWRNTFIRCIAYRLGGWMAWRSRFRYHGSDLEKLYVHSWPLVGLYT